MKILMMGGTLFAGRAVVEEALAGGHDVTTFNRGRTNPELFDGDVEKLVGDRNENLDALRGRSFDVVVDTSAYLPRHVRSVVEVLDGHIGHYSFVSSASVYAGHQRVGADETDPVAEVPPDVDIDDAGAIDANYGPLKAACERTLEEVLPGRAHYARAGLIVGPHDDSGRFAYWLNRVTGGGDVLAPDPPDNPIQLIDVRDLAAWLLTAAEGHVTGPVNAVGDPGTCTMGSLFAEIVVVTGSTARFVWVDQAFLAQHDVQPWSDLPFWLPPATMPTHVGFLQRRNDRARAAGLRLRPLAETIQDTVGWLELGEPPPRDKPLDLGTVGLTDDRQQSLLETWERHSVR
jgi:2'-hydroxyisoflavone reductase